MTVIGFFGNLGYDFALPLFGGAMRYFRRKRTACLRDFLFTEPQNLEDGPPWKGKVDGIILATSFTGGAEEAERWLSRGGVPGVSVVSSFVSDKFPSVFTDPRSVAALAFAEFARLRASRLLTIGLTGAVGATLRGEALEELARAKSIPVEHQVIEPLPIEASQQQFDTIVTFVAAAHGRSDPGKGPLGVLAINDEMARVVVAAAGSLGLAVPTQVAVVGVDDSPVAFRERPTITSVQYPGSEIGYRAAEMVVRLVEGKPSPPSPVRVASPGIVVRETTGGSSEWPDEVGIALELIRRDALSGKSVGHITGGLPISQRTLQRRFRERIGVSPQDELNRVRLARSRELLRDSSLSVSRIAALVGFSETAAFTKFFHRHTGQSPRAHRNDLNTAE